MAMYRTVGYGDLYPQTSSGKTFTIFYCVGASLISLPVVCLCLCVCLYMYVCACATSHSQCIFCLRRMRGYDVGLEGAGQGENELAGVVVLVHHRVTDCSFLL